MTEVDAVDRNLIAHLTTNARMPVAQLAKRMGLARTTVQARLDRLERQGFIAGYAVRLSDKAEKGMIAATVLIHILPAAQTAVIAHLKRLPQVQKAHTTSGRFDLACLLRTASTLELDQTLDQIGAIDGVQAMESLIHLSTRINRSD